MWLKYADKKLVPLNPKIRRKKSFHLLAEAALQN